MSKMDNVKAFVKDNESDILIGGGIIAGVLSAVTLVFATIKAVDEYKEHKDNLEMCETIETVPDDEGNDIAVTEETRKDYIRNENLSYAWQLTKLYALPVVGGIISIGAILTAHKIDKNEKNEAIALAAEAIATASSIAASFAEYRKRVVETYGAQADYDIYMGRSETEVVTEEVDPKTGKTKNVKKTIVDYEPIGNPYEREWSMWTSTEFTKSPKRNLAFLKSCKLAYQNQVDARGYAIANDFYQHLGIDTSVGPDQTEKYVPNGVGTISNKIWELLPDEWDWKGRHYVKSEYSGVLDLGITAERLEMCNDDIFHGRTDEPWFIKPNFYPIDPIVEFAHAYFKKKKKGELAADRMVLKELDTTRYFDI